MPTHAIFVEFFFIEMRFGSSEFELCSFESYYSRLILDDSFDSHWLGFFNLKSFMLNENFSFESNVFKNDPIHDLFRVEIEKCSLP